jgi:hypothetical protein
MRYTIEVRDGYLRGEMLERETPEETRQFGDAMHAAMVEKGLSRVLAIVRASRPIFRVEEYQLSEFLRLFAGTANLRVAVVSDSRELAAAHQYIELIASQKGVALRAFATEKAALEWLLSA